MISARFNKADSKLNVSVPVETPRPSASGKSELIATSGGVVRTDAILDGRRVHLIFNAFVYPEGSKPKPRVRKNSSVDEG